MVAPLIAIASQIPATSSMTISLASWIPDSFSSLSISFIAIIVIKTMPRNSVSIPKYWRIPTPKIAPAIVPQVPGALGNNPV